MTTQNIIQLQEFDAVPDAAVMIEVSQNILLMPIFKWQNDHWVDATGEYDLCMEEDGKKYKFINRTATTNKYAYRFVPVYWLVNRLGKA